MKAGFKFISVYSLTCLVLVLAAVALFSNKADMELIAGAFWFCVIHALVGILLFSLFKMIGFATRSRLLMNPVTDFLFCLVMLNLLCYLVDQRFITIDLIHKLLVGVELSEEDQLPIMLHFAFLPSYIIAETLFYKELRLSDKKNDERIDR